MMMTMTSNDLFPTDRLDDADVRVLLLENIHSEGAENLKAKLALTGFEAAVQEVDVPNKGTMHRVRVGPFSTAAEMNSARQRLSQAGIVGTVIKQKP